MGREETGSRNNVRCEWSKFQLCLSMLMPAEKHRYSQTVEEFFEHGPYYSKASLVNMDDSTQWSPLPP